MTKKALKVDNLFSSLNTELALLCLFLLGGLSFDTAAYSAQDMEQSQAPSSPDVSRPAQETDALVVERGPFETERRLLLAKIQAAERKGVGIQTYMTSFTEVESMAAHGSSAKVIGLRIDSIENALSDQLSHQLVVKDNFLSTQNKLTVETRQETLMPLDKARAYVLSMVNADRAQYHLPPLKLDIIATIAAQRHTDEMATKGYYSHWDTSGKKPWQRYNEAGWHEQ